MRLLLDTHIFIWAVNGDRRLRADSKKLIQAADDVLISAASTWESALKIGLGKLRADIDVLSTQIAAIGYPHLPVEAVHAARVVSLPPYHRDPFDRILVAQAMTESLHLLTADKELSKYTDLVVLA